MVRNGDGGLWSWWEGLDRKTEVVVTVLGATGYNDGVKGRQAGNRNQ